MLQERLYFKFDLGDLQNLWV